jgi:acetolactate decarboxylase
MATVYQHGTLAELMAGLFGGTETLQDLLAHGDTGIGTLHGLDGEVIILDGEVYQADETGRVNHIIDLQQKVPFANVHFADKQAERVTLDVVNNDQLDDFVEKVGFRNNFAALTLHGTFDHVKVRVAPKSTEPFPTLAEIAEIQPVFESHQVAGTLVGYFSPDLYAGAVAPGWHLHFLSDDRQFGGHMLEVSGTELVGRLEQFEDFNLHLPIHDAAFENHQLQTKGLQESIIAAES